MLERQVIRYIRTHRLFAGLEGTILVIGVSGGPDSLALLHLLRTLASRYGLALHAAHLDHGFRGAEGAADAAWVAATCAEWGIPATVRAADVPAFAATHRLSPEDAARRVRYTFLWGVAAAVGARAIAVAHSANDQVETVILRLLRGTGPAGLAGMSPQRVLRPPADAVPLLADWGLPPHAPSPITLLRPLLATPRSAIEDYCAQYDLQPRRDATNTDLAYTRNRVRHEVIPLLEQTQPGFTRRTWRLAAEMGGYTASLDQLLDLLWPRLSVDGRLVLEALIGLPSALQERALLRFYRQDQPDHAGLTRAHLAAARRLAGPAGAPGHWVQWPGSVAVVREYGTLAQVLFDPQRGAFDLAGEAARYPLLLTPGVYPLAPGASLALGPWRVRVSLVDAGAAIPRLSTGAGSDLPAPWTAYFDWGVLLALGSNVETPLVLRTRQPGERFHPLGLGGRTRRLQDVLTEAKIPRRLRDQLALVALPGGEVLWVPGPGGRRGEGAKLTPATRRALVVEFARP